MHRNTVLLASVAPVEASAFFNTHSGAKLFICATPQPADLTAVAFAALTWVEVRGVGSHGETGTTTNILTYDTWDSTVMQKAKGMSDAGSPDIELARIPDDPGQVVLRDAADTNYNYAFKIEMNDKPNDDADSKPTIKYNRGLVTGPRDPQGRNEDFDLEVFSLGLNQKQIKIDAVDGS